MQDIRQSLQWKKYGEVKDWKVIKIPSKKKGHIQGIIMPLGILGLNLLKIQRAEENPVWEKLKKIKRKYRVISSVVEPAKDDQVQDLLKSGYRLSSMPYLATKTIVVDLRQNEELLWKNLSENTRRLIKKNGELIIKQVSASEFLENWKGSSKIWTMKLYEMEGLKRLLGEKVSFLLGYIGDKCQSGILLIETKDTAVYYHSFTTSFGRNTGAHFKLVWETLLGSKKKDLKWFDFEGIYDSRWPQKRWIGFTEFKGKFGGEVISFPGCFYKWF